VNGGQVRRKKSKGDVMNDEKQIEIRIHIDREPYQSPNPTTGSALYHLAKINGHRELFRETEGAQEDELVPKDGTNIRLHQDEHFYSQVGFEIIVNARQHIVSEKRVTFEEVVQIAFPGVHGENIVFSVTYRHAASKPHAGELGAGGSVEVKRKGTIFNVTRTDKS
jgi:Multiubiquitin